jgi:hypothetical protein
MGVRGGYTVGYGDFFEKVRGISYLGNIGVCKVGCGGILGESLWERKK